MEAHSKPKTGLMFFMGACLLAGGILIVLFLFLPHAAQRLLTPLIAEATGIPQVSLTVRHIGLSGADLETATVGDKSAPGLVIDTIKIDYSLTGLLKKEVKKIQLSGIRLYAEYQNGALTIPGFFPTAGFPGHDNPGTGGRTSDSGTGFRIGRIEVKSAAAYFKIGNYALAIPFDLLLKASHSAENHITGELKVYPHGQVITCGADIDLTTWAVVLEIAAANLALDQISPVSDWIKGAGIHPPLARVNIKSAFGFYPEGMKGKGSLEAGVAQSPLYPDPAALLAPVGFSGDFTFDFLYDGSWSFAMNSLPKGKTGAASSGGLKIGESVILFNPPILEVSAKGANSGGHIEGRLSLPDLTIKDGDTAIALGSPGFRATVSWNRDAAPSPVAVSCLSDPIALKSAAALIQIPRLSFDGQLESGPADETRISGVVNVSTTSVFLPSSGVAVSGISVRLPVCWPCNSSAEAGEFSVAALQWDKKNIGSISGTLQQGLSLLEISGTHRSLLAPGLLVAFTGRFGISPDNGVYANVDYKTPLFKTRTPLDLGRFSPEAAGLSLEGEIGFSGDFQYGRCGPKGSLNARLLKGTFKSAAAGVDITDMEAQIHFTDLLSLKSAPSQTIRFASAKLGGIEIQNGRIAFHVESPASIFIEKSSFSWCNGNVDVHALRIESGVDTYQMDLYCDRLNLAMLLNAFGAADASGKGAVNGKIPIRYANGRLFFEDGFLYSTPGQGGTIKVAKTEQMFAEIATGDSQAIQMALAKEALKSYDYDWATVEIATEGEDLLLRMELSGKPTHPLPFIYQKETGGFVRIQSGEKGSSFQGINLNINFRLPLDQMLRYRNVLKMFD